MTDTCQVEMINGKKCGRRASTWTPTNEHCCVCHLHFDGKPLDQFTSELKKILSDKTSEYYDFSGFVFPSMWKSFDIKSFDKPVYFIGAIFEGDVEISQKFDKQADFSNAVFRRSVEFRNCWFNGLTDFVKTRFEEDVVFWVDCHDMIYLRSAVFCSNADFRNSTFRGGADFMESTFESRVDFRFVNLGLIDRCKKKVFFARVTFLGPADFSGASFKSKVDFDEALFCVPRRTSFREVDLSRTLFNRCDISGVNLDGVQWSRQKHHKFLYSRNKVYDEIVMSDQNEGDQIAEYQSVAQTYRRLQANYGESYRYPEAGDFYVGEREMVRQSKGGWRSFTCLDFFYKLVSNYGESYFRPFLLLVLVLLLFPAILIYSDVKIDLFNKDSENQSTINYDFSLDPRQLLLFSSDYWRIAGLNLNVVFVERGKISAVFPQLWSRLFVYTQILLVIILVTFLLLALRRKFKRKSF